MECSGPLSVLHVKVKINKKMQLIRLIGKDVNIVVEQAG